VLLAHLTNDLYHYTGADVAIYSILGQGLMRLGPYESTNDPQETRQKFPTLSSHESVASLHDRDGEIWKEADRWLRRYVKVACFTQDFELPDSALDQNALRGWAHMSLWAHYGGSHGGVCLRFDRAKLVHEFHAKMGSGGQCFDGPVQYPVQRISALPVEPLDVGQVLEFGVDAVVSRYIEKHHRELFFTKHHDWANESEFRLILNEQSLLPAYLSIKDCLTGVVLGDAFPAARLDAVRHLLSRMPDVELVQLRFVNGNLMCGPAEPAAEETPIAARRSGLLAMRIQELRSFELQREQARAAGANLSAGIADRLKSSIAAVQVACATWHDVEAEIYPRIRAVPPGQRSRKPGVPGEVVEFESGWMCVVENLPKYSYTLVVALAIQLLEGKVLRFHGLIALETWLPTGNETSELWRICRESAMDQGATEADALAEEVHAHLQLARQNFDARRST
jgi:Protein of unknown function (DUF2971)